MSKNWKVKFNKNKVMVIDKWYAGDLEEIEPFEFEDELEIIDTYKTSAGSW